MKISAQLSIRSQSIDRIRTLLIEGIELDWADDEEIDLETVAFLYTNRLAVAVLNIPIADLLLSKVSDDGTVLEAI